MVPRAGYACRHAAPGLKGGLSLLHRDVLLLCGRASPGRDIGRPALDMETERQKVGHRPGINDGDNMLPTYRTEPSADDAVDAWLASHGQDEGAPAIAGDTSRPELYSQ